MPASGSEPLSAAGAPADDAPAALAYSVGQSVRLRSRPRYLKSADPMPMLRPPDLVDEQESGLVMELRPQNQLAVRFRRGTFLLEATALEPAAKAP